jgi:hypothetical protein
MTKLGYPLEYEEHKIVADWLRLRPGLLWTTVPNERKDVKIAGKLKRLGVSRGVPDILIFTPPPAGGYAGAAIEMKRKGYSRLSDAQKFWQHRLRENGWFADMTRGADEAIKILAELGY